MKVYCTSTSLMSDSCGVWLWLGIYIYIFSYKRCILGHENELYRNQYTLTVYLVVNGGGAESTKITTGK